MNPESTEDWPRVAEMLSAILLATEKGREEEEREVWKRVIDGRPFYAWMAMFALARPGVLEARANGYLLTWQDVTRLRLANPALCFDQAPESPSVGGYPMWRPDLFRPAASAANELPAIPCSRHPGKTLADCGCPTAAEAMGIQPHDSPF